LEQYEEVNRRKKDKLYGIVKKGESEGVLRRRVQEGSESWMNVTFEGLGADGMVSKEVEQKFVNGASQRGMLGLNGHRSVGGLRASIYNAVTEGDVERLVDYIKEFIQAEKDARA